VKLLTTALGALVRPIVRFGEGWRAFWFTPADPTVLGVIRIFAGLVLFYVMAASSPLLMSLYARDGWIDLSTADILRHELPWLAPPGGWDDAESRGPQSRPFARPELSQGPEAEAYFGRWDLNPGHTIGMGQPGFSQWFHVTDPFWMKTVHYLALVVALLLIVGLATRVTSMLAWVLMLGYMHRAPASLFGMDTMMALVLLYLMVGPSGAALSLDRLIERFRVSLAALAKRQPLPRITLAPSVSANVVLRLFQVHFCIICLATGAAKIQGAAWSSGTAVWQVLSNYEFTPPRFEFYTTLLHWLTANRVVCEAIGFSLSVFVIGVEFGLPFLIWHPRLRWLMIIGVVILHTGIALTMGLVAVSLLMIVMVLAFMPAVTVNALLERLFHGPARPWLLVCSRPRVGIKLASLVHALDGWGQVSIADVSGKQRSEDEPAWLPVTAKLSAPQLVAEGGQVLSGYPLVERLVRSLHVLWPVALVSWLPGVGRLGRAMAPGEGRKVETLEGAGRVD
jgi:uncharacterized membrane protein YphA (DoxX/SURF4 family)